MSFKFQITLALFSLIVIVMIANSHAAHQHDENNRSNVQMTSPWPQIGFDSMHSDRVPFLVNHADFASNLSIPFNENLILPGDSMIFHTGLQKLIMPITEVYSKPNVQIIYLVGFYLIDVTNGKVEKTNLQLERRYSIEQNAVLDSKGILYIPLYDNLQGGSSLLKVNTWNWSSFSITPFTSGFTQVGSVLSESNNCLVFLLSKSMGCVDLDNPRNIKWNITIPEEPYGSSSMLIATENNQDVVYVALMHNILKVSVTSGKLVKVVNLGDWFISSINYMDMAGFLSFSYSANGKPTSFGVMHVDSGNYNSMEHVGITSLSYTVSTTFLDHALFSSYVFKTVVFSSEARTTARAIHIYNFGSCE